MFRVEPFEGLWLSGSGTVLKARLKGWFYPGITLNPKLKPSTRNSAIEVEAQLHCFTGTPTLTPAAIAVQHRTLIPESQNLRNAESPGNLPQALLEGLVARRATIRVSISIAKKGKVRV